MTQPKLPKFNLNTPNMSIPNNWFEEEIARHRIRDSYDWAMGDDLLTTAYRKYTVDKFRQKRKHRKLYKFFIKLNK